MQGYDPGSAARQARRFLVQLEQAHQPSYDVMLHRYQVARAALVLDIQRITKGVASADQLPLRQEELLRALDTRIAQYLRVAAARGNAIQKAAVKAGLDTGAQQMREWGIAQGVDVNQHAVGALQGGLEESLAHLPVAARQRAAGLLSQAVTLGWGPKRVAREMAATADMTRARSEMIARTEMIRAYREGNLAQWQANPTLVGGWIWHANPSVRTCPICFSMSGTWHPLSESMTSHPNCRCTMIPVPLPPPGVDGSGMLQALLGPIGSGEDMLRGMSTAQQLTVLGPARHRLWESGTPLNSMVRDHFHPVYGNTRRLVPLRELQTDPEALRRQLAANLRPAPRPRPGPPPPPPPPAAVTHSASRMVMEPYTPGGPRDVAEAAVTDVSNHALSVIDQLGVKPPAGHDWPALAAGGKGTLIGGKSARGHYRIGLRRVELNASQMGRDMLGVTDDAARIVKAGYAQTVIHELGHHLDFTNRVPGFDRRSFEVTSGKKERAALNRAMKGSWLYQNRLRQDLNRQGWQVTRKTGRYWRSEHEMIARAFQQYAARKTGDQAMLTYLSHHSAAWDDDDFALIEPKMEAWLRAIGWLA